jgi:mono/diheme cytochrome c family protein
VRWTALIAAVLVSASVLAACQSRGVTSATPSECVPASNCGVTTKTVTFPIVPAFHVTGNPHQGKAIFLQNCGSCHTLADAGTSGTIGPNLDALKPNYQAATAQVTNGGSVMPSFNHTLSTQQIADVAAYVVTATGGTTP